MNDVAAMIEALLFASAQPLTFKRLGDLVKQSHADIVQACEVLQHRLEARESGLMLVLHGDEAELVTRPEMSDLVRAVIKTDLQGELSKPSMEALAILAYRGPMTRPELEQIRGVQSALILRNLMMRGLVSMKDEVRLGQPVYEVTMDFYKHLGMSRPEELPKYDELRGHSAVIQALAELEPADTSDQQEPEAKQSI